MKTERKILEDWAADITYGDQEFSMYQGCGTTEAFFPRRPDIDKPRHMIDAALSVFTHPDWSSAGESITFEDAMQIIFAISIADSLHEITELIKWNGVRPVVPHPDKEASMWDILTDIGHQTAKRLLKELEKNDVTQS